MEIQITVNGSKCKQYNHDGKTYVEAKNGSEYVIDVKNNHWKRVLAVGSVDGLNILTGKTASEGDTGYIIGSYSSEKIKGFRFSDDEWAMFKFGYKFNGKTYAQSKEDGSEKNCGVIGLRFFYEQEPVITFTTSQHWGTPQYLNAAPFQQYTTNVNYTCDNLGTVGINNDAPIANLDMSCDTSVEYSRTLSSDSVKMSKGGGQKKRSSAGACSAGVDYVASAMYSSVVPPVREFDMGTEFGRAERSKITNVSFERGSLAQSFDIYYASREALIAMGVPITNELKINLPQSFPGTYCVPPVGWKG